MCVCVCVCGGGGGGSAFIHLSHFFTSLLVTLKESGVQDVFVLCTDAEMRRYLNLSSVRSIL